MFMLECYSLTYKYLIIVNIIEYQFFVLLKERNVYRSFNTKFK